jgi:hypothetical protein
MEPSGAGRGPRPPFRGRTHERTMTHVLSDHRNLLADPKAWQLNDASDPAASGGMAAFTLRTFGRLATSGSNTTAHL